MSKIPTKADVQHVLALIASVNASGQPLAPLSRNGRYIRTIEENCVRDLRGLQFEREVREAFDRAISTDLWTTLDDSTRVFEEDATGMLIYLAIAQLVAQLGCDRAVEALARIAGHLHGFEPSDLRETVLNCVDDAVYGK